PQSDESILNLSSIPNITKPVDVDLDGSLLLPTGELHGDTLVDEKHQGDTFTLPDFVSRNALENTRNAFLSNVSLNNAIHAWNALVDGAGAASNRLSVAWIGCIPFFIFFILFVDLLNNDWLLKNDHIAWGLVASLTFFFFEEETKKKNKYSKKRKTHLNQRIFLPHYFYSNVAKGTNMFFQF
ncbi:hypothetical protein RFI_10813, partial [Reticulomyxa filosa]